MTEPVIDSQGNPEADAQRVLVRGLEVWSNVGVPDEERAQPQRLLVDLEAIPATSFAAMNDSIERAVDYDALAQRVRAVAGGGERRLIETLAVDLAEAALKDRGVSRVTVRIRKFILPDTEFVGVELTRSRQSQGQPGA